jgi:thiol:disulfide interchange protein
MSFYQHIRQFTVFISVLFIIFNNTTHAQSTQNTQEIPQIQWHSWSDTSFSLAAKQHKLVLLDLSAQWCQFCQKMKATTYQNSDVISIINEHYIAIHADIENNLEIQKLYGHFGVPGTLIFNSQGQEINKRLGYIAPQQMQWHLLGNLQDALTTDITAINHQ